MCVAGDGRSGSRSLRARRARRVRAEVRAAVPRAAHVQAEILQVAVSSKKGLGGGREPHGQTERFRGTFSRNVFDRFDSGARLAARDVRVSVGNRGVGGWPLGASLASRRAPVERSVLVPDELALHARDHILRLLRRRALRGSLQRHPPPGGSRGAADGREALFRAPRRRRRRARGGRGDRRGRGVARERAPHRSETLSLRRARSA